MPIFVKAVMRCFLPPFYHCVQLTGETITLFTQSSDTVFIVKYMLYLTQALPVDQQRLVFAGSVLDDDKTLEACSVQKESTLHLICNMRGS